MPGTWSRPCAQTVDRDVVVPYFDAGPQQMVAQKTSRPNLTEEISLLTPTPPPRQQEPSTSAKQKSFVP